MPEIALYNMNGMLFSQDDRIQYFKLINNKILKSLIKCF